MSKEYKLFASSPLSLEHVLAQELESIGAQNVKEVQAGVHFTGDQNVAYRSCLWARTANRVFLPIKEFECESKDQLYSCVKQIKWENIISGEDTFAINSSVSQSFIKDERFASLVVKDGLADYFTNLIGKRANVEKIRPKVQINLHIHKNNATISLDLSGDSLHRRGYRLDGSSASLKENTAAALLLRSNWKEISVKGGAFVDPMCGGATLPIEAALIAGDIAPGLFRSYFGFFGWTKHDPDLWEQLWDEAEQRRTAGLKNIPPISGFDEDSRVITRALDNIKRAGLSTFVHVEKREFSSLKLNANWKIPGLIAINPPYGERLGETDNLRSLYRSMGDLFKERFPKWHLAMITSNAELSKSTGLRAEKVNTIYNGSIKCMLLQFPLSPKREEVKTYQKSSNIPLAERYDQSVMSFANRLNKRKKHITKWAKRSGISSYRIYDADLPDYNVAIDFFEKSWALVQEYTAPKEIEEERADKRIEEIMEILPELLSIDKTCLFLKRRKKQKGNSQYEKMAKEGKKDIIGEGGCKFWVNFTDYLDTGIFLDHRIIRSIIKSKAHGKKFLNLFCYTGTATVMAAAGGAKRTISVDTSKTYLQWAKDNMALNGFGERKHDYIKEDSFVYLKSCKDRFDLIFLDPPTFSNTKNTNSTFDIQRDHVMLIKHAVKRLEQYGLLIFSNNFRKFKLNEEELSFLNVKEISTQTISEDFNRNKKIHRSWEISLK